MEFCVTVIADTCLTGNSDNGGARNNVSSNGALRDFKHSVYEGGKKGRRKKAG